MPLIVKYVLRYGGFFIVIGAIALYYEFSRFETTGGRISMPWILIWLYEKMGKWGVVATLLALAAICFTIAIVHYIYKKTGREIDPDNRHGGENIWD